VQKIVVGHGESCWSGRHQLLDFKAFGNSFFGSLTAKGSTEPISFLRLLSKNGFVDKAMLFLAAAAVRIACGDLCPIAQYVVRPAVVRAGCLPHHEGEDVRKLTRRRPRVEGPFKML
jgi:hypothetical protein